MTWKVKSECINSGSCYYQGDHVPDIDIDRAIQRKKQFETNPEIYTYEEERENGNALKILKRMTANDPEIEKMVQESSLSAELAQLIYTARTKAGLTLQQLAKRIDAKQSVIARLEDAHCMRGTRCRCSTKSRRHSTSA